MYRGEPHIVRRKPRLHSFTAGSGSKDAASPKSAILSIPLPLNSKFCGLISR